MPNLYNLTEEWFELVEEADRVALEGDDENEMIAAWTAALEKRIGEVRGEIDAKLEILARIIRQLDSDEKALNEEKRRFAEREKAIKNRKERLKAYTTHAIRSFVQPDKKGRQRVETKSFLVWIQKKPLAIDEDGCDATKVDDAFVEFVPKFKKREMLEHIKTTGEIPDGVELKEQGWTIRIK